MAKGMDRGNVGHKNKPKSTLKEKQLKRKQKKIAKQQTAITSTSTT